MRHLTTLLLGALLLACAGEEPIGQAAPAPLSYDEGPNVLSLLRGATIVDRSGEASLEFATMLAIDGQAASVWYTTPKNLEEWLVAELPTAAEIEKVGVSLGHLAPISAFVRTVKFEASMDGEKWSDLGTFEFALRKGNQLHEVSPVEARFVRVTTLTNHGSDLLSLVPTILVWGRETSEWQRPSIEGRWLLNDQKADLRVEGSRVYGIVDLDPPMFLDGAWDGRVARFAWMRGPNWGVGILAASPGGSRLDGIWWYETFVDAGNELGTPWFGTRIGPAPEFDVATSAIAQMHIERNGVFPVFGLVFDDEGSFDRGASEHAIGFLHQAITSFPQYRVRLEVSELRSNDPARNLEVSRSMATSLREGLVSAGFPADRFVITGIGSERPYPASAFPLHHVMYSRVDFSLTAVE